MADQTEVERLLVEAFPMCDDPKCRYATHARGRIQQAAKRDKLRPLLAKTYAVGYEAGARAMRERAAKVAEETTVTADGYYACLYETGGQNCADKIADAVRSLPLTEGK